MSTSETKEDKAEASELTQTNPLLLDDEGALTDKLYEVLKVVFARYSAAPVKAKSDKEEKVCGREGLNQFARDTNGQEMTDETYNEIVEFLDVTEEGELTFKGFIQLYSLQTENDPAETENDLRAWGYDPSTLELTSTSKTNENRADEDEGVKPSGDGPTIREEGKGKEASK